MESSHILLLLVIFSNLSYGQGFRLPNTQIPSAYDIKLTFPEDIFDGTGSVFNGTTIIYFQSLINTYSIQLHVPNSLDTVRIVQTSFPMNFIPVNQLIFNKTLEVMQISFFTELVANSTYELTITYQANVDVIDRRGVYRSTYEDELGLRYLVATQFQPTHARKAFPCFDEPKYKAKFNLTLNYPSVGFDAYSNTGYLTMENTDTEKIVQFATTPEMSTYLVAFVISNFTCTWGQNLPTSISQTVCSRRDTQGDRYFANQNTGAVIGSLQTATGFTYGNQGFNKLSHVAIPDFYAGAMENWGLPIYRESLLLWNREQSSDYDKQKILAIISHELAHFWFGNLVTNEWWGDLFLNEGFATYFEYFVPANISTFEVDENWQMWRQFVIEQQQLALDADGSSSSKALSASVETPDDIQDHFGTISYSKGAAILRMLENTVGRDKFLSGIRNYVSTRAFQTALADDLFNDLEDEMNLLPVQMNVFMQNWTNTPGYPLVTVSLSDNSIRLTQKRFLYDAGVNSNTEWYIPISYTVSTDLSQFQNTTPKSWMIPGQETDLNLELGENGWIILNNQESAYYRVKYDANLWNRIQMQLTSNHQTIDVLNRAQIVDDALNLARSGEINYREAFSILNYLYNETDYFPWYSAVKGFDHLAKQYGENTETGSTLIQFQLYLLQNAFKVAKFTLDEANQINLLRSRLILGRLCRFGEENCVATTRSLFNKLRNGEGVDKNFKSVVYCNGLRYSNDVTNDWNFMWDKLQQESVATEQQEIISALGCIRNQNLLRFYLNESMNSTSIIRVQDFSRVWSSVYSSGALGFETAFTHFIENYKVIFSNFSSDASKILTNLASRIHTRYQLARLAMLNITVETEIAEIFSKAVSAAADNLEWSEKRQNEITTYFSNNFIPDTTYPTTEAPTTTSPVITTTISTTPTTTQTTTTPTITQTITTPTTPTPQPPTPPTTSSTPNSPTTSADSNTFPATTSTNTLTPSITTSTESNPSTSTDTSLPDESDPAAGVTVTSSLTAIILLAFSLLAIS